MSELEEIKAQSVFWRREILDCLNRAHHSASCPDEFAKHWEAANVARLRYRREVTEKLDALERRGEL